MWLGQRCNQRQKLLRGHRPCEQIALHTAVQQPLALVGAKMTATEIPPSRAWGGFRDCLKIYIADLREDSRSGKSGSATANALCQAPSISQRHERTQPKSRLRISERCGSPAF
jgi:hypothetical protein